jgi:uncharacterized membrane protein YhaH (DUF805 family)
MTRALVPRQDAPAMKPPHPSGCTEAPTQTKRHVPPNIARPAASSASSASKTNHTAAPPLWGLAFSGRIGRLQWLTGVVLLIAGLAMIQVIALKHPDASWIHGWRFALGVAGVMLLRLCSLRLHDRGRSAWWTLTLLIPGLNLLALIELLLMPGDERANDHGPVPPQGSIAELAFGGGVLLLFAVLGVFSLHPAHALDTLKSAEELAALSPYGSTEAKKAFLNHYRPAPHAKAFAASMRGAHGWVAQASSVSEASDLALKACDARRRFAEQACVLIDVNDRDVTDHHVSGRGSEPRGSPARP